MTLLRRFLVIQALLFWQGGFLFYVAVVVPTGADAIGAFEQARVTRQVTHSMNIIGIVALVVLAWDQWAGRDPASCRRMRWGLWIAMAVGLAGLCVLHPRIESYVDFGTPGRVNDYPAFYLWHRVYLYVATAQWIASLGYVVLTLRVWYARPAAL